MSCLRNMTNIVRRLNNVSKKESFLVCYKNIQEFHDSVATNKGQNADPRKNSHPVTQETGIHSFTKTREPLQLAVGTTQIYTKENFPLSIRFQAMPAVHRFESCKGKQN